MKIEDLKENEIYTANEKCKPEITIIFKWKPTYFQGIHSKKGVNKYCTLYISDNNVENITISTPEEKHWFLECEKANKFIPKEEALKSFNKEVKLEVDKWYKLTDDGSNKSRINYKNTWIVKATNKELSNVEYIFNNNYRISGNFGIKNFNFQEVSLEEIQDYLPDGHPDKISKSIELTSLPKYWYIENKYPEVREYLANTYNQKEVLYWTSYTFIGFTGVDSHNGCHGFGSNYTEAQLITFDQFKKWVLKEEIKENFPEYYEFIGIQTEKWTFGKIYKINNPSNLENPENFIDNSGNKNGFTGRNRENFKPSTKEAFDIQNNKQEVKESLVGRYIKALVDKPNSGKVLKDSIGLITFEWSHSVYAKFKEQSNYSCTKSLIGSKYELMPKDYNPNNIKEESLLDKAKRLYPVGTKYLSAYSNIKNTIAANIQIEYRGENIVNAGNYLYYNGKWAEIITKDESLIEKGNEIHKEILEEQWIPKVGDWCVVISTTIAANNSKLSIGELFQAQDTSKHEINNWVETIKGKKGYGIQLKNIRKALPQEIPSNLPKIEYTHFKVTITKDYDTSDIPIEEPIIFSSKKRKPRIFTINN